MHFFIESQVKCFVEVYIIYITVRMSRYDTIILFEGSSFMNWIMHILCYGRLESNKFRW